MTLNHKHSLFSILIIILSIIFVFYYVYPSHNAPTDTFGLVIFCILTLFFALIIGLIAIILRPTKHYKHSSNFMYNFSGTLNIVWGILGILIAIFDTMEVQWIISFVLSFGLGLFINSDIYYRKKSII
jgi:hypothetical protein